MLKCYDQLRITDANLEARTQLHGDKGWEAEAAKYLAVRAVMHM